MYSSGKNDECYTPRNGVSPILKYIPAGATVWCPFDKAESEFVKEISKQNPCVFSHIEAGQDFYEHEPDHWDVLVSNPPFTRKRQIFERALSFGKPFALLMTNAWLNDSAPKQLFAEVDLQLLMFDKRIQYGRREKKEGYWATPPFSSSYYCRDMLPKQIIMERLPN